MKLVIIILFVPSISWSQSLAWKTTNPATTVQTAQTAPVVTVNQAVGKINHILEAMPFTQRYTSPKAKYFRCLKDGFNKAGVFNEESCADANNVGLSASEKDLIKNWQINLASNKQPNAATPAAVSNNFYNPTHGNLSPIPQSMRDSENSLVAQNTLYTNCDSSTPEINLEENVPYPGASFQGPFVGVPRDIQGSLGTCYANTAKNLLVGMSGGKSVASFLDMAVMSKKANNTALRDGIEAGFSCAALSAVKDEGYCPQDLAPLERGERNEVAESLFNSTSYNSLSKSVTQLRDFFAGVGILQKSNDPQSLALLNNSKMLFDKVMANSYIVLPLPVARVSIPEDFYLRQQYSLLGDKSLSEAQFISRYKEDYKRFYPQYVKALMDGKNLDQVMDLYEGVMSSAVQQAGLNSKLPKMRNLFKSKAQADFNDPDFQKKLHESIKFMKEITNQSSLDNESFSAFCASSFTDGLEFLKNFQPLVDKMRAGEFNSTLMFDDEGKFKSASDLMQLAVAPSCINSSNRVQIPYTFYCSDGYEKNDNVLTLKQSLRPESEKLQIFREKIVLSLLQGYPLGNTFSTSPYTGHINTIVGLRFNRQAGQCEYRIRESASGTSEWHSEKGVFSKINALTEVRRK